MRDSLPIARTPRANAPSATATVIPTPSSRDTRPAIGSLPPAGQEVLERRFDGALRLVDRADELHVPFVQEGDPVSDEKGRGDVVRHHDRGDVEARLHAANQLVDGHRG